MIEELNTLKQEIKNKVDQTTSTKALNEIRVEYLGKKDQFKVLVVRWEVYLLKRKKNLDVL